MIEDIFYSFPVINISQLQTGIVVLGKITFTQLMHIHVLSVRKESLIDPFGNTIPKKKIKYEEEFQRRLNISKLNKIKNYLTLEFESLKKGKSIGLFPSSLILAFQLDEDYDSDKLNDKYLKEKYTKVLKTCFINKERTYFYVPKNKALCLIVDGQHRLYGVKKFYESLVNVDEKKIIEAFEFAATFLLDFDVYQLGKIFATVNFTQKPVNRSLYYDIFGSIPDTEKNDIKLAHDLALHLNNYELSPIKDMIKMLGTGYGLFSQAFFVEKMLIHFRENGVWEYIYIDYLNDGDIYKILPIFMRIYLECIKDAYEPAWPNKIKRNGELVYSVFSYDFILCKTTGLGAFFRLIKNIFPLIQKKPEELWHEIIFKVLSKITKEEANVIFSKEGNFGEAASEGLQVKLYKYLKEELKLQK